MLTAEVVRCSAVHNEVKNNLIPDGMHIVFYLYDVYLKTVNRHHGSKTTTCCQKRNIYGLDALSFADMIIYMSSYECQDILYRQTELYIQFLCYGKFSGSIASIDTIPVSVMVALEAIKQKVMFYFVSIYTKITIHA